MVLGVNRAGDDPYLAYAGGSVAFGPRGETLAEAGHDPGVTTVEVDPASAAAWRASFRAWDDAKAGLLPRLGPDGRIPSGDKAL